MNKKLKLALAALLGFSTACSTVKNAPAKGAEEQKQETGSQEIQDSVKVPPRIVVMYGVRPPVPVEEVERQQAIREKTARKEVKKAQRAREKEAPASKNE